ncbi:hypothetical protein M427DRAFT_43926 [Gonapodya prolifera JEL478]|uniref:Leucine-rich repeat-containing protein 51 n=1 Tax=Gonapodya prolifera (strain JEL478) TaxID=1344416 RepID=A0A139AH36_GONPJ|nr:hypothetical protein M427DRAFT_43926 [Gonapodya prolifera JEL478]|eukprot:KXS16107.1 hypothetical protein M427DRAFT_43926 [Gonapodya prolifera JEL478]
MKEIESVVKQEWATPVAEPLDYSFKDLDNIEEILAVEPRTTSGATLPPLPSPRSSTPTAPTRSGLPQSNVHAAAASDRQEPSPHAIRLSNNNLSSISGLDNAIKRLGEKRNVEGNLAEHIEWVDLSFNKIAKLDLEALLHLPNLSALYLHANNFTLSYLPTLLTVLARLPRLHTLTLHGNPMGEALVDPSSSSAVGPGKSNSSGGPGGAPYRSAVVGHLTGLRSLDFSAVTKGESAAAKAEAAKRKKRSRKSEEVG